MLVVIISFVVSLIWLYLSDRARNYIHTRKPIETHTSQFLYLCVCACVCVKQKTQPVSGCDRNEVAYIHMYVRAYAYISVDTAAQS